MASKIILLGSVDGQLKPVFSKLASLHAKNNFSIAIVAGNLFSEGQDISTDLLAGNISIPLPTYFTVGNIPLPQEIVDKIERNEELYPNLYFLGNHSTTITSEGIKIVTLGGNLDKELHHQQEQYLPFHTIDHAKALHAVGSADILLTTSWPATIRNGSKIQLPDNLVAPAGYDHIASLCASLKPRYHISVSPEFFFEREPFFHSPCPDTPNFKPITRFISLAAYATPKQKYLYAFTLPLTVDRGASPPLGTTVSPWTEGQRNNKRQALDLEPVLTHENYGRNGITNKRNTGRRGQRKPLPGPEECFFCLSNPKLATHLISSIGEDTYLTIAKGPLPTSATNTQFGIDCPAHVLIIPLTHSPTISMITDENNSREKTYAEMIRFKDSLQNMVASKSNNKLGAVTYEISSIKGIHSHWQFVPLPQKTIREGLVETAFRNEAQNLLYPPIEVRDSRLGLPDGNFFRAWIWYPPNEETPEGKTKCIIISFDDNFKFSLQYGRSVLAKLLNLENRIQWKDCIQSAEEEKKDIEVFKAAFKEFDFTC